MQSTVYNFFSCTERKKKVLGIISHEIYPGFRTKKCHCLALQLVSFYLKLNFFSLLVVFFPVAGAVSGGHK